jgi:hypothetical protein
MINVEIERIEYVSQAPVMSVEQAKVEQKRPEVNYKDILVGDVVIFVDDGYNRNHLSHESRKHLSVNKPYTVYEMPEIGGEKYVQLAEHKKEQFFKSRFKVIDRK